MNLLTDGISNGAVIQTNRATKMRLDGLESSYPIYQVRLDLLYYNDQNDRIATWISQYKSEKQVDHIDRSDLGKYNDIIQDFIVRSNPDRIRSTQKNIEFIGQQRHGLVLKDGRIIDGNRRFTCLRRLAANDPKFNYFETVILDRDIENNAKQIKMLELQLQIGEEARVDYDPIDRLAGIYQDIVKNKLLTVKEYAQSINFIQSESEIETLVDRSKLLVEFLEAINAPLQFYLARDMELGGPLEELQRILKRVKDEDKREQIKYIVFTNLLMQPTGDMTRFIRKLKNVVNSVYMEDFIEKELEVVEDVLDQLPSVGQVSTETVSKARENTVVREQLKRTMDVADEKVKATATRNKPNQMLERAIDALDAIDFNIIRKMTQNQRELLAENLEEVKSRIRKLESVVENDGGAD